MPSEKKRKIAQVLEPQGRLHEEQGANESIGLPLDESQMAREKPEAGLESVSTKESNSMGKTQERQERFKALQARAVSLSCDTAKHRLEGY